MNLNRQQNSILAWFVTLSLALHLLLIYLLPQRNLFDIPPAKKPVIVELLPPESLAMPRERELEAEKVLKEEPPEKNRLAKRLGPVEQRAKKEIAPRGDAPEERRPTTPPQKPSVRVLTKPKPVPKHTTIPTEPIPLEESAPEATETMEETATPLPKEVPKLESLLKLPQTTIARLEDEWRNKYRSEVEEGEAVWLDMEKDILISFFKRFRDNIYGVWNYPPRSVERREEGTCLLKITILRNGSLKDVQLMESSGFRDLDNEALRAVKKAAPFGTLPRIYTKDELSIFAFFRYDLFRRVIY